MDNGGALIGMYPRESAVAGRWHASHDKAIASNTAIIGLVAILLSADSYASGRSRVSLVRDCVTRALWMLGTWSSSSRSPSMINGTTGQVPLAELHPGDAE